MPTPPPGWYLDGAGRRRYWTGRAWTGVVATPPRGPVKRDRWVRPIVVTAVVMWSFFALMLAFFAVLWLIGALLTWTVPMLIVLGMCIVASCVWLAVRKRGQRTLAAKALAQRADYEHSALMRGQIGLGVYGQFQPPKF